jgi:hypothetical protein
MFAVLYALGMFVADLFKSRSRLEAENLFLRHQLSLALRQKPVVPENPIRPDSRVEAESAHHPGRCLVSFSYLGL